MYTISETQLYEILKEKFDTKSATDIIGFVEQKIKERSVNERERLFAEREARMAKLNREYKVMKILITVIWIICMIAAIGLYFK